MTQFKESRLSKNIKLVGIPILGFLLTFVMNNPYELFTLGHLAGIVISIIFTGIYWLLCNYIVIYLWNKYPWHISPLKHLLIEIGLIILIFLSISVSSFLLGKYEQRGDYTNAEYNLTIIFLTIFLITTFHEALFFYIQWQEHFKKSALLEKANVEAKYDVLKTQVNPHFLFNSLNTLLSFVGDNKEAGNYIENMSDFLRYTLNSKDEEIKSIEEEIKIVEKYFYLQKSRFGNNIDLQIKVADVYKDFCIPTLSLQMIVENAIKHNIISKSKPLKIKIFVQENYIIVENNYQKRTDVNSTKQGLNNITDRYKFLSNNSVNIIIEQESRFIVELPMLIFEK